MRWLQPYLCTWLTVTIALSPIERRSLIPTSLRKKLCERNGDDTVCNFGKSSHNSVDDDNNYSKWSICKYHPELLLCKWDPSSKATIPEVRTEAEAITMSWNSAEASLEADSEFRINALNLAPAVVKTPIVVDTTPTAIQPQHKDFQIRKQEASSFKKIPVEQERPRYDGKLSSERELPAQTVKSDESPEEDEFGENIMLVKDDIFG